MLPLRYLFNNPELARMILDNWDYDKEDPCCFKFWRISSNAVYGFQSHGIPCYLRFTPLSESSEEKIQSELDFLSYLCAHNFPANQPVLSLQNRPLEVVETPWGTYCAVVFQSVIGTQLDYCNPDEELITGYGRLLGRLHTLSQNYTLCSKRRWNHEDQLEWILKTLCTFSDQKEALKEAELLGQFFSMLPRDTDHYGLIHYDFEQDNLFYDKNQRTFSVIDFDDAVYHFYALDAEQALYSIRSDGFKSWEDAKDTPQLSKEKACSLFLSGYYEIFPQSKDFSSYHPLFRRYANLYGYTRILRSTRETWNHEPDWMMNLRQYLNYLRKERSAKFGTPLEL